MDHKHIQNSEDKSNAGWNDPPLFAYDECKNFGKSITHLKRSNYVKSCTMEGQKCFLENSTLPAKHPPQLSPLRSTDGRTTGTGKEEKKIDVPVSLSTVVDNFMNILMEIYTSEEEKNASEIKRRLILMETMWKENKFPEEVQQKLFLVSEALKNGNLDECDYLQRGLMVDHTSLCRNWMAAIRLLINSKRDLSKE